MASKNPWITVIGIGEDGLDGLSNRAIDFIKGAEILAGGERHLNMVPENISRCARMDWSAGFGKTLEMLEKEKGKSIVVLASGDPMYFGVGSTMARKFGSAALNIIPAPGCVSLACAAMGWSQPDVDICTVHGRPIENIIYYLGPKAKIIALSDNGKTPARVAKILCRHGYGGSEISVLENLGGENENIIKGKASDWKVETCSPLNTMAIKCVADAGVQGLSHLAGLPIDAYEHDGQITKAEVRAITLARLSPCAGETLWDVGSGSGSIAIEWMRACSTARAIAIEKDVTRSKTIEKNAFNLGVTRLKVMNGHAPGVFSEISNTYNGPDAIFIGGGLSSDDGLLDAAWDALKPGGRLVANGVTTTTEARLENFAKNVSGQLTRINIERQEKLDGQVSFAPLKTVTQLVAYKPLSPLSPMQKR